jgi:hypothetical protein
MISRMKRANYEYLRGKYFSRFLLLARTGFPVRASRTQTSLRFVGNIGYSNRQNCLDERNQRSQRDRVNLIEDIYIYEK